MRATSNADRNFILQQGFEAPDASSARRMVAALRFQPRVVGLILVAGTVSQSPAVFAVLAALLWTAALLPRLNPFDFVYRHTPGLRPAAAPLEPAPMPRRFAAGLAATIAAACAATIVAGFSVTAWVLQAFFLLAVAALIFGRFCLGSFIYHLLRGRLVFAIGTLPWRRCRVGGPAACTS
jgi:hypothetical protein